MNCWLIVKCVFWGQFILESKWMLYAKFEKMSSMHFSDIAFTRMQWTYVLTYGSLRTFINIVYIQLFTREGLFCAQFCLVSVKISTMINPTTVMCVCHSHTHIIKSLLSKYLDCDIIFNTGHNIISFSLERHSQREQDRRQCAGEKGRERGRQQREAKL